MFTSIRQQKKKRNSGPSINIAPLIDVVFILLIFFLVTSVFVQDRGLEIDRPAAAAGQLVESRALRIAVTEAGNIYIESEPLDIDQLKNRVSSYAREAEQPAVVLLADKKTITEQLVEVMDAAKEAGVRDIAIATREQRE